MEWRDCTLGLDVRFDKIIHPSRDEIVNESIRQYFMRVYEEYCNKADPNDMMKRMMKEVIP